VELSQRIEHGHQDAEELGTPRSITKLHVRDGSGKEAPLTEPEREVRTRPIHGSGDDVTLAPGERDTYQEDLSNIYNISVPGSYTVESVP